MPDMAVSRLHGPELNGARASAPGKLAALCAMLAALFGAPFDLVLSRQALHGNGIVIARLFRVKAALAR